MGAAWHVGVLLFFLVFSCFFVCFFLCVFVFLCFWFDDGPWGVVVGWGANVNVHVTLIMLR